MVTSTKGTGEVSASNMNNQSSERSKCGSTPAPTASGFASNSAGTLVPADGTQSLSSVTRSKAGGTITDFVNSRFASIERICNPISSTLDDKASVAPISSNGNGNGNITQSGHKNDTTENEEEDDEAYATLTYLALLTSLYLPLLLFLWIRRSMFGTASLCRSLFLGHMLRLILAFMLLPPSTTKTFVPTWLWNFGVNIGHTAEKLWKDKRTQAIIPTWFHLLLAFVLGIENDKIPTSTVLANLGSCNEKDTSWPPPALVALGIFTLVAFVVHPDGLTWIMLSQIRIWIQDAFQKATDGIRMMKDGTIKITLAELSGTIASIIIIVTILRALINPIEPPEKARAPHREKRNHKHKRGKRGRGGRHHHSGNGGGKAKIRSGHYRSSKDLYEPTASRSRSPSPLARVRSESDLEAVAVSALSELGAGATIITPSPSAATTINTGLHAGTTNNNTAQKQSSGKHVSISVSSKDEQLGNDTIMAIATSDFNQKNKNSSSPKQQQQSLQNKKSNTDYVDRKTSKQSSSHRQQMKHHASHPSETSSVTAKGPGRRSHMSTNNGEKLKRGHGKKGKRSKQQQQQQNKSTNPSDIPKNNHESSNFTPTRQVKSHAKARKNHVDDQQHNHYHSRNNHNNKVRDFECDTTIGSNASYSNSDCQNNYSNTSYFSSSSQVPAAPTTGPTAMRGKEEKQNPVHVQNRRRSFTDPNSSLPRSYNMGSNSNQSLPMVNDNSSLATAPATPQMHLMGSVPDEDRMQVHKPKEVNKDPKLVSDFSRVSDALFDTNNVAPSSYHGHEIGTFQRNQMYSQFDGQRGGFTGDNGDNRSSGFRILNNSYSHIPPPPGLVPSQQNQVVHASILGRTSSENSQQGLPFLTSSGPSSSTSLYSNFSNPNSSRNMPLSATPQTCNDHFNVASSNVEYSQHHMNLHPISPLHRVPPAPIGYGREMKYSNDEEIEANLLALGGQMAGSILDF